VSGVKGGNVALVVAGRFRPWPDLVLSPILTFFLLAIDSPFYVFIPCIVHLSLFTHLDDKHRERIINFIEKQLV